MIERDEGHIFELKQLGTHKTHTLQFIKRSGGAIQYEEEWPGLQTQEVIRSLIRRTIYLNNVIYCDESDSAIWNLRMALWEYEARAYRRKMTELNRKEGKHPEGDRPRMWRNQIAEDVPFGITDIPVMIDGHEQLLDIEDVPIGHDGHMIFELETMREDLFGSHLQD